MPPTQINNTTYEYTLTGGDKVEIGDIDSPDFRPHLKLNRWDGECFIKANLPTTEKGSCKLEGGKCKWSGKDLDINFYPLEPRIVDGFKQNELGGFEFEIILKKKPASNRIVLNIETQGLKFYYQRELTAEEIADGAIRPDNVVGSYAVYHATRANMHRSQADAEKYKCGKAFHIYRPKIADAEGSWVWGELSLDEQAGTLTTMIPQEFLDNAVYPISTGTTNFGYETPGGSRTILSIDYLKGSVFTCSSAGTANSITFYLDKPSGTAHVKGVLVLHSNLNIVTNGIGDPVDQVGEKWSTSSFSTSPDLSASTEYVLMAIEDAASYFHWDDGVGTEQGHEDSTNSYASPTNPTDAAHADKKYSIYCTYEEAGPAVVEGSAAGSGIGLASSSAKLDVLASALGNGIGLSQSSSFLIIPGLASGEGAGLGAGSAYLIIPASASGNGIGLGEAIAKLIVLAEASGNGIGLGQATGEVVVIIVYGTGAGSGVGTATAQGILDVLAQATGSGAGEATVQAILDILAEAGGSGVGLGSTEALIRVLAAAAASGEGLGSAEALLEVIAEAAGEGIGSGQGQSYIIVIDIGSGSGLGTAAGSGIIVKLGQGLGSGIGSGTVDALLEVLAEALGSGVGEGLAEAILTILAQAQASGIGIGAASGQVLIIVEVVEGIGAGSGVGIASVEALVNVLASAIGHGIGDGNVLLVIRILPNMIRPPSDIHGLGRVKSVPYNLGRSLVDYTLGRKRR